MEFLNDLYLLVFIVAIVALIFILIKAVAKDATADMDVLQEWTTSDSCRHRILQCNECLAIINAELLKGKMVWHITDDDSCECFGN